MSGDTQKNKKTENPEIKKEMEIVGPEYPTEVAISKVIIAGFTAVKDLLKKNFKLADRICIISSHSS